MAFEPMVLWLMELLPMEPLPMLLGFDGAGFMVSGFMVSGFMELAPDIPMLPLPMPLLDIVLLDIEPLPMLPEVCARAIPEQARPKLKVAAKRSRDMTGLHLDRAAGMAGCRTIMNPAMARQCLLGIETMPGRVHGKSAAWC
jgi:hypothetical protein